MNFNYSANMFLICLFGPGEGLSEFIHNHSGVSRSNIFLQSKFTPAGGQDLSTVPYDVFSSLSVQVEQSMTTTLQNLQTHYLGTFFNLIDEMFC